MMLLGLGVSSALADGFSITAYHTVNGSDVAAWIPYGGTGVNSGKIDYSSSFGPVPIPVNYFFHHTVAYGPFAWPTRSSGNVTVNFTLGTSAVTGQKAYNINGDSWGAGNFQVRVGSWATVNGCTNRGAWAGTWYNATGSGSGHLWDDNQDVQVIVNC